MDNLIQMIVPAGTVVQTFETNPLQADVNTLTAANATLTQEKTALAGQVGALNVWIDAAIADALSAKARDEATVEGQSILGRPRP